jgi:hypothetical protein
MKRRTMCSVLVALTASTLALVGCGGSSPSAPSTSGRGVVLQGTVLSGTTGVIAHAGGPSHASGKMVVTVQEKPSISTTVAANGTFELEDLPPGTITLVFTVDGTVVGTVRIDGVAADVEVHIVVQVTADGVILISITIEGPSGPSPSPSPSSSPNACLISGGVAGTNVELEGKVASGTTSLFQLDVQGNRAGKLVDVNASSASWRCVGQSGDCKTDFKTGNQVHVRGLLTTCTADVALVNATEVKVQKP